MAYNTIPRNSYEIYNEIKKCLISIKYHGGQVGQYDNELFELFIEAYKNNYMNFKSAPRLTGQAIIDLLYADEEYKLIPSKTRYDLDARFNEKWTLWTEAFDKGFTKKFIRWSNEARKLEDPDMSRSKFRIINYDQLSEQKERDLLLASECHIDQYKNDINYPSIPIQIKSNTNHSLQLNLFILSLYRFHEMSFEIPKDEFVCCIEIDDSDIPPCIFVKDLWLKGFMELKHCCYGLIDESDFKIKYRTLSDITSYLKKRHSGIQRIADKYPHILFTTYSDSILLKLSWSFSEYESTYQPEHMIEAFNEIHRFFRKELESDCYGIFIQGINYSITPNLFFTNNKNMIDLNCYGSAFANLYDINNDIKKNINNHGKALMYVDYNFLSSLRIEPDVKENLLNFNSHLYCSNLYKSNSKYISLDENILPYIQVIKNNSVKSFYARFILLIRKILMSWYSK